MEPLLVKEFQVSPVATDRFGRLKPSQMLGYLQEIAGDHSNILGLGQNQLTQKNLYWVVIRHGVQITRLPTTGEKIRLETWPLPTTRTAYPRSTIAYDEKGEECFRSISLWALLDSNSRALVLPKNSGVNIQGLLRGCELQVPSSMLPKELGECECRAVRYSDLDINGHMNNCRYLDWVIDLLPSEFYHAHEPREITLCYMTEIREKEEMELHWELSDGPVLTVDAVRREDNNVRGNSRIFSAKIGFQNVVL